MVVKGLHLVGERALHVRVVHGLLTAKAEVAHEVRVRLGDRLRAAACGLERVKRGELPCHIVCARHGGGAGGDEFRVSGHGRIDREASGARDGIVREEVAARDAVLAEPSGVKRVHRRREVRGKGVELLTDGRHVFVACLAKSAEAAAHVRRRHRRGG